MDRFQRYADAFMRASDRTRAVYLVIVGFSVVCLGAFINSAHFGWHRQRLERARLVYAYLHQGAAEKANPREPALSARDMQDARSYIDEAGIRSEEDAKALLGETMKQYMDSATITVPLFGTTFDVNDLGLISGVALILLTGLLTYALGRERDNLRLAYRRARSFACLEEAYELLSTSEVLHRPKPLPYDDPPDDGSPPPPEHSAGGGLRRYVDVPVLILFAPVVSYAVVLAYDYRTVEYARVLSPSYGNGILLLEPVTLLGLIGIAVLSFRIVHQTRELWADMETRILDERAKAGAPAQPCQEPAPATPVEKALADVAAAITDLKAELAEGNAL